MAADNYTKLVTDFEKDAEKEFELSVLQLNVTEAISKKSQTSQQLSIIIPLL